MIRGQRIHEEVEHYISGKTDDFPSSGKKLQSVIEEFRFRFGQGIASVEAKWGFNQDWEPVGWWGMATDYHEQCEPDTELIVDWKTGKSFGNEVRYMQQMQLYSVGAFMRNPELEYLDVGLYFLDDGKVRTKSFQRGDKIIKLLNKFTQRANRIRETVNFRANPSLINCKYCAFGINGTKACVYAAEPL